MTIKREIEILDSQRQINPDLFERRLGLALRSRLTRAQNQIIKHFGYHQNDIGWLIKLSYQRG